MSSGDALAPELTVLFWQPGGARAIAELVADLVQGELDRWQLLWIDADATATRAEGAEGRGRLGPPDDPRLVRLTAIGADALSLGVPLIEAPWVLLHAEAELPIVGSTALARSIAASAKRLRAVPADVVALRGLAGVSRESDARGRGALERGAGELEAAARADTVPAQSAAPGRSDPSSGSGAIWVRSWVLAGLTAATESAPRADRAGILARAQQLGRIDAIDAIDAAGP